MQLTLLQEITRGAVSGDPATMPMSPIALPTHWIMMPFNCARECSWIGEILKRTAATAAGVESFRVESRVLNRITDTDRQTQCSCSCSEREMLNGILLECGFYVSRAGATHDGWIGWRAVDLSSYFAVISVTRRSTPVDECCGMRSPRPPIRRIWMCRWCT